MTDENIDLTEYNQMEIHLIHAISLKCGLMCGYAPISARYKAGMAAIESLRADNRVIIDKAEIND